MSLDILSRTRYGGGGTRSGQSHVAQKRPDPSSSSGRVLPFRPRRASTPPRARGVWPEPSPVGDLAKYERTDDGDDYRHRMRMNTISIAFVTLLVIAGIWIADTMAEMQKNQDCALQGRRNCMSIDVPVPNRR